MQKKSKRQSYQRLNHSSEQQKMPGFQEKVYSFADPLFQSFGNGYRETVKNNRFELNHRDDRNHMSLVKDEQQNLDQLLEMSEKISLLKSMLKINKMISNPSVILVNTQNKVKTQMLIESKKKNSDNDSKLFCQNAQKYINFLTVVNEAEHQNKMNCFERRQFENEVKFDLESRIQNSSYTHQQQNYRNRFQRIPEEDSNHLKHDGTLRLEKDFLHPKAEHSFTSYENSKYLSEHPKSANFSYNFQTAEKMFQKIQTPKISQNIQQIFLTPKPNYSSQNYRTAGFRQNNKSTFHKKSPLSSAVIQGKQKSSLSQRQNIHNQKQKMIPSQSIHDKQLPTDKLNNRKSQTSSSKSKGLNFKQNIDKQKLNSNKYLKPTSQKISIAANIGPQHKHNNLALQTIDKTNQFEKMLKMASSRIDPSS